MLERVELRRYGHGGEFDADGRVSLIEDANHLPDFQLIHATANTNAEPPGFTLGSPAGDHGGAVSPGQDVSRLLQKEATGLRRFDTPFRSAQ